MVVLVVVMVVVVVVVVVVDSALRLSASARQSLVLPVLPHPEGPPQLFVK